MAALTEAAKRPPALVEAQVKVYAEQRRRAQKREVARLRRERCKAEGVCVDCSGVPTPGRSRCPKCLAIQSKGYHKRHEKMLKEHRCTRCGDPVKGNAHTCPTCRRFQKDHLDRYRAERLAHGLCAWCGKQPHRPGRTTCPSCGKRSNVMRKRWYIKGRRKTQFRLMMAQNRDGVLERLAQLLVGKPKTKPRNTAAD